MAWMGGLPCARRRPPRTSAPGPSPRGGRIRRQGPGRHGSPGAERPRPARYAPFGFLRPSLPRTVLAWGPPPPAFRPPPLGPALSAGPALYRVVALSPDTAGTRHTQPLVEIEKPRHYAGTQRMTSRLSGGSHPYTDFANTFGAIRVFDRAHRVWYNRYIACQSRARLLPCSGRTRQSS